MKLIFFFLKKEIITHKLSYSKTMKSDIFAAFLGVTVGAIVSWLGLAVLGSCSINLADLTILFWYLLITLIIFLKLKNK